MSDQEYISGRLGVGGSNPLAPTIHLIYIASAATGTATEAGRPCGFLAKRKPLRVGPGFGPIRSVT